MREVTIRFEGTPWGYRGAVTKRARTSALLPPPSGSCLLREGRHGDGNKKPRNVEANAEISPVAVKLETSSSGPRIGEGGGLFSTGCQGIGEIQALPFPTDPHRDVASLLSESTVVRRRVTWLASPGLRPSWCLTLALTLSEVSRGYGYPPHCWMKLLVVDMLL